MKRLSLCLIGLFTLVTLCFGYVDRTSPPLILAHRAGALLVPENTLQGWAEVKQWYEPDVWELDVHLTADDSLVVIHDADVDRTTNGVGMVREQLYEEIVQLDAGFWFDPDTTDAEEVYPYRGQGIRIPTLAQVFDSFPDDYINIEIKDTIPYVAHLLADLIVEKNMTGQVVVGSVHDEQVLRVRELEPDISTGATPSEIRKFVLMGKMGLGFLAPVPEGILQVPEYYGSIHVVTPGLIRRCHKRGLLVHVWTVNDALDTERFLKMGADGIITDRPDMAATVAHRLGLRQ